MFQESGGFFLGSLRLSVSPSIRMSPKPHHPDGYRLILADNAIP